MPQKNMIVEDEVAVSTDIRVKLILLGYEPAYLPCSLRRKVLDAAMKLRPDHIFDGYQAQRRNGRY